MSLNKGTNGLRIGPNAKGRPMASLLRDGGEPESLSGLLFLAGIIRSLRIVSGGVFCS